MFKIFIILSVFAVCIYAQDRTFCDIDTIVEDPDAASNPLPKLADDLLYECHIEQNADGSTAEIKEYYDGNLNRARARNVIDGLTLNNYIYPKTEEFLNILATKCSVKTLEESAGETSFQVVNVNGKKKVVGGTFAKLQTLKNYVNPDLKIKYTGDKQVIRGIPVRQWEACDFDDKYTFHYILSYSAKNWIVAEGTNSVPVEFKIVKKQKSNQKITTEISSIIKYHEPKSFKEETFYTESGIYCPNRKNDKKIPEMPQKFSAEMQISIPKPLSFDMTGDLSHTKVEYDFTKNLFKDLRYDNDHIIKEIQDWNTGLKYVEERSTGECNIVKLSQDDKQTVASLFKFDQSPEFQWTGQKRVRGLNTDVWIAPRDFGGKKANFEWYFTTDLWVVQEGRNISQNVPVLLIIVPGGDAGPLDLPPTPQYYHLFNWETTRTDLFDFDVSRCQNVARKNVRFEIKPDLQTFTIMELTQEEFRITLANSIVQASGVSLIRIGHLITVYQNQTVFVTFSLFDRPSEYGYEVNDPISLDKAEESLHNAIKNNQFTLKYRNLEVKPDANSYILLERNNGRYVYDITETGKTINYSLGSVIAFLVVFALVGVAAGFVLGYFLIIKRQKALPELPGPLGFLNPGYNN